VATNTQSNRTIVRDVVFYAVHVSKERRRIVLHRTSCYEIGDKTFPLECFDGFHHWSKSDKMSTNWHEALYAFLRASRP
jgi:hypothetical protein